MTRDPLEILEVFFNDVTKSREYKFIASKVVCTERPKDQKALYSFNHNPTGALLFLDAKANQYRFNSDSVMFEYVTTT